MLHPSTGPRGRTPLSRVRAFLTVAGAALLAACGGGGGGDSTGGVGPDGPKVATVQISQDSAALRVGATLTLSATGRDASGTAVPNRTVTWTSSDVNVARVEQTGLVTAIAPGMARITATIDGRQAGMTIIVIAPVATVNVTAPAPTLGTGGTMQLAVLLRDATGGPIGDRPVTWTSSDNTIASVTGNGIVTGLRPGTVTISAQSEGITGSVQLAVVTAQSPTITAVSPETLEPGGTITITGANFGGNPGEVSVTVDGVAATVMAVAGNTLTARLAMYPCQPTRAVPVEVRALGGAASANRTLRVARQRQLGVGEAVFLSDAAEVACNELPATGRYLVNVVNSTVVVGASATAQVKGIVPGAPAQSMASVVADPAVTRSFGRTFATRATARASATGGAREHIERLGDLDRIVRRLGPPRTALQRALAQQRLARTTAGAATANTTTAAATAATAATAPVPLTEGATTTLKLPNVGTCSTYTNITARVVHVGPRSVVLEASDSPLAGTMDEDYKKLGMEFDQVMYDLLRNNFADPLALDRETDNNGRIVMLFTRGVNNRGATLLGFVTGCDFYPPTAANWLGASNQAEIFYARVPTKSTSDPGDYETRSGWLRVMRSTVMHEAKHIAAIASRILGQAESVDEAWLEEATAQAAAEIYGRSVYPSPGNPFRGNTTYRNSIYCEYRPSDPSCAPVPYVMDDMFAFLSRYFRNTERKSYFSSPNEDVDIYGSAWLFVRWAADQYATDEGAFFRALTQESRFNGLSNIAARTGRSIEELQTRFALALYADDYPGISFPNGTRFTVPSWQLRDMWAGLNADWPSFHTTPFPLQVRTFNFGTFATPVALLPGGGAMYVEIAGSQASPQLLELSQGDGTRVTPGSPLRLAILRVQ